MEPILPPPATFLHGCSEGMSHWLSQLCLTVLLGEAAKDFESFSNISRRKPTLQACFPSLQLWVCCIEIVFVALHLIPQVPPGQCCCLASQIHACLLFLFCFAQAACRAAQQASELIPGNVPSSFSGSGTPAEAGQPEMALGVQHRLWMSWWLSCLQTEICSLLTGLYLDVHAAR